MINPQSEMSESRKEDPLYLTSNQPGSSAVCQEDFGMNRGQHQGGSVTNGRASSMKSRSPSIRSVKSKVKAIELDAEMRLSQLNSDHEEKSLKIEREIRTVRRHIGKQEKEIERIRKIPQEEFSVCDGAEQYKVEKALNDLRNDLAEKEDDLDTLRKDFERERNRILRFKKIETELNLISDDDEQDLDIEDEKKVEGWNRQHNHNLLNTEVPSNLYQVGHEGWRPAYPQHVTQAQHPSQYGFNPYQIPQQNTAVDGRAYFPTQQPQYQECVPANQGQGDNNTMNAKLIQLMETQLKLLDSSQSTSRMYADKKLPTFSGDPSEWLSFIEAYSRSTRKYRFDDPENMMRLHEALKGDAKESVKHLMSNPANLQRIIITLEKRFGRAELILDHLFEKVKEAKSPDLNKPETVVEFGTMIEALVTNIYSFNKQDYLHSRQLVMELVKKCPMTMQNSWYMWLAEDMTRTINLQHFSNWITPYVDGALLQVRPKSPEKSEKPQGRSKRHAGVHAATDKPSEEDKPCDICGRRNHESCKCRDFKKMSQDSRWEMVKERSLCWVCLCKGHSFVKCDDKKECGIDGCTKYHHRLLHRQFPKKNKSEGQSSRSAKPQEENAKDADHEQPPQDENKKVNQDGSTCTAKGDATLPIIPVWIKGPKGTVKVFALLDTGSNLNMIESSIVEKTGLDGKSSPFSFTVFGKDVRVENDSRKVSLQVAGAFRNSKFYNMQEVRTVRSLGIPGSSLDVEKLKKDYPYLRRMKVRSAKNAIPQMIIGCKSYRLYSARQTLESSTDKGPTAYNSRLGWYVMDGEESNGACFFAQQCDCDKEMHNEMKHFFSSEGLGVKAIQDSQRSKEDKRAIELLEKNTVKVSNRWQTSLLWKQDNVHLPNNKMMAVKRLKSMEKKMDADREFADLVMKRFQEYQDKGYLIPKEKKNVEKVTSNKKWYLPWFFAYHPTKKPRLVFDAAAKYQGRSLNDYLLKGPDYLNPLPSVLMNFRRHKIALTGDIKEMFHQVKLCEEDWPSQTILFRGMNRNDDPKEYYMSVLFFGAASSPCSAIYAKNKNAELYAEDYPDAVKAILQDFYMDDFLGGEESEEAAIRLRKEITDIHAKGGFEVVKWNSNSQRVLDSIPNEIRAEGTLQVHEKTDIPSDKTLGMWWNPQEDEFGYRLNFHRVPDKVTTGARKPTKREMTSLIMSLFDPLGFVAPLKIKALILMQDVWRSGVQWDEDISHEIAERWKEWLQLLPLVKNIRIKRRMTTRSEPALVRMHVFADASEEAFSSAVYLAFVTGGRTEVAMVAGKARVAPLRGLSVPKMELQAALMGTRLAQSVKAALGNNLKINQTIYWSDSKSVLYQLRSNTLRYKTFESNRIGEILELTNPIEWQWVPSQENVADDATRLSSEIKLNSDFRWLKGSDFIYHDVSEWPKENREETLNGISHEDLGVKATVAVASLANVQHVPNANRFSSWMRLVRATATILLFRRKCLKLEPNHITVEDVNKAKLALTRASQAESFPNELKLLKNGEPVEKSSRLYGLTPEINADGLIVLEGRINKAEGISSTMKQPPILDPKHPYTKLWIEWKHRVGGHFGQERILNKLRQSAWILNCRSAVRRCWAKCEECKIKRASPQHPQMGQLPAARLGEGHLPFHHTGVDCFGPLMVTANRKTQKRWGVIFTCMSTRAVHLELIESMDTSAMINAMVRFMTYRGKPAHIWSDNGTNFVGANKEIRRSLEQLDKKKIEDIMSTKGVEWHFNPPAAPHMGGSWERLIGSVKKILDHLLHEQAPREDTLRTVFAEVSDILNSRPLTYVSVDATDEECLTPNHFLKIRSVQAPAVPGVYDKGDCYRRSWRHAQFLADHFWKRWTAEYLPTLIKREKWQSKMEPLQVGDLVIVVDDLVPRSSWKKGVIIATYPARDGQVRKVDVKVASVKVDDPKKKVTFSVYHRPSVKVCPLGLRV